MPPLVFAKGMPSALTIFSMAMKAPGGCCINGIKRRWGKKANIELKATRKILSGFVNLPVKADKRHNSVYPVVVINIKMKKTITILFILLTFLSCDSSPKTENKKHNNFNSIKLQVEDFEKYILGKGEKLRSVEQKSKDWGRFLLQAMFKNTNSKQNLANGH